MYGNFVITCVIFDFQMIQMKYLHKGSNKSQHIHDTPYSYLIFTWCIVSNILRVSLSVSVPVNAVYVSMLIGEFVFVLWYTFFHSTFFVFF